MCGVFGVYGPNLDASRITYFGLSVLQHRGQESSGIAVSDGQIIDCYKNEGLVSRVYDDRIIKSLRGHIAIGHNRYSTSGTKGVHHAQPFVSENKLVAMGHNGNLPSVTALKTYLKSKNIETNGCGDSELMTKDVALGLQQGKSIKETTEDCFRRFTGAFSVVGLTTTELFAFRDEYGLRPLSIGLMHGGYVIASESCAFNIVDAKFLRDVRPGELVIVNENGLHSIQIVPGRLKIDAFEYVYFARPDSVIEGRHVDTVRSTCGEILAKECPLDVDLVIPVPDTAIQTAMAYGNVLNLPVRMALVKNRYIHRTFIQPEQHTRDLGVRMKLYPMPQLIAGKRVAIIDDSIVRGTTIQQLVKSLFEAGAKEVHVLISSPPVRFPDFYGINTPKVSELIAVNKTVGQIRDSIGANSLHFLSLEGLVEAIGLPFENLCLSCFNGEYPIDLHERAEEIYSLSKEKIAYFNT